MLDKKRPQLFHGWRKRRCRKLWKSKIDCILILCLSLSEIPWYLEWPDKMILGKFEEYASWCAKGWRVLGCVNSASSGRCFTYSVQMETSLMFFSVHLLFNIYYISATFPHKLHFSSCILEIECAIIWTLLFFVPFRDIEKGKVFCRAILIIIRLESEPPWWNSRNR